MKLLVPDRLAGAIIGKGGSGIVELETQTGCSLRLSASGVYFHGTSERVMVVTAQDAAAYDAVIPVLVERLNGPPAASAFSDAAADHSPSSSASVVIMRLVLSNTACSFLIGKGGETIKSLCQQTGAIIRASDRIDHPPSMERIVEVRGLFDAVVAAVKDIILDKVAAAEVSLKDTPAAATDSALYYAHSPSSSAGSHARSGVEQFAISIKFAVPGHSVGAIIGKSGETRARIVQITGAKVQVSDRTADLSADREISVTGPLAAVKAALTLVVQQIVEAQ
jgi:polyribonucleotide nucleotidyltransferase